MTDVQAAPNIDTATDPDSEEGWGDVKPDAIRLLSGGRIFLRFDGAEYRLRGPDNRFLHDLQQSVQDLLDGHGEAVADLAGMQKRIMDEADSDPDRINEIAKETRGDMESKIDTVRDQCRVVVASIVKQLEVNHRQVDEATLPPWCEQVDLITSMIAHWRRVPKVPGA